MEILLKKLKSNNFAIKMFLIRWINVLNEIVTINTFGYLPEILESLLPMLEDKCKEELKNIILECLNSFKKEMEDKFYQGKL
jgi:hypothetical protein